MSEKSHTSRITSYKNAAQGTTDLRRKRAELSIALRKQARDEQLLKRRALSPEADGFDDTAVPQEALPTPEEIIKGLKSSDLAVLTSSARAARRMLSREQNPPITMMVKAGAIEPLIEALERDDCTELQFEAAWALTNIASGTHEHTMAVIDGNAVPQLIALLARGGNVGEQCAWALGNIAGDGAEARDIVLASGVLPALIPSLAATASLQTLRTAVWTYSNLCRNKDPLVKFSDVAPALPFISELLLKTTDQDVLADACWALSYLTDGPNDRIEAVQATPFLLQRLVILLDHKSPAVKTPALRAVGNMLTGSDEQTDRCLDAGCLPALYRLLSSPKSSIVKEASWAASNILAGTSSQIERGRTLLGPLALALNNADIKAQKEAAWAITNLCLGGSAGDLDALFATGFLESYTRLLESPDHRAVAVVLEGLTNLLQAAVKYDQLEMLTLKIEEVGALDRIEALQTHANEQIYKKTLYIIDNFFNEAEDEAAAPQQNGEEFTFNANAPNNIQF